MNEDLHNNDELFNEAYKQLEETPSPEVWEKLNVALDKKDAAYYRSRMKTWKSIAVILFLLLGTGVFYHFFLANRSSISEVENDAGKQQENKTGLSLKKQILSNIKVDSSLFDSQASLSTKHSSAASLKNNVRKQWQTSAGNNVDVIASRPSSIHEIAASSAQQNIRNEPKNKSLSLVFNNKQSITASDVVPDTQKIVSATAANKLQIFIDSINYKKEATNNVVVNNQKVSSNHSLENNPSVLSDLSNTNTKQNTIHKKSFTSWNILPYVSIEAGGQKIDDDEQHNDPNDPDRHADIEKREHTKIAFSAGFFVRRNFASKFSISSGLNYAEFAVNISPQTLYAKQQGNNFAYKLQTSSGYSYITKLAGEIPQPGDSITTNLAEHHLSYLQIPLMAGYRFTLLKKLYLQPNIGVTGNIFLHSKYKAEYRQNNTNNQLYVNDLQGVSQFNFAFIANAELQYQFTNKVTLVLMPSFKTAITPITKNNPVNTFPYSAGVGVGLLVNLNN